MKTHKYQVGNIVGVVADCMADCEILECLPKEAGHGLSYLATAVSIHHPHPEQSFFGQNVKFVVPEKQIVVRLSDDA